MNLLSYFKGLILAGVTLLLDVVVLPVLDRLIAVLDFLPDVIEAVWMRLKTWSEKHRKQE